MSIVTVETELRDENARHELGALLERMDDRQGFYATVGERILASSKDRFREENSPDGTPWAALKPKTIKARTREGQTPITILRSNTKGKSGSTLAGSLNYIATNDEVRIGSPLPHAAIHQLGGVINKPAREGKIYRMQDENGQVGRRFVKKSEANHITDVTIPAHKITIPARPYLGLTAADEAGILEDAENWLIR